MTQLVKDTLYDTTVVERIVEVVVPATSYQVTLTAVTPEEVARQKAAIRPDSRQIGGGSGSGPGSGSAYSYDGIDWRNFDTDAPKPPGWVVL